MLCGFYSQDIVHMGVLILQRSLSLTVKDTERNNGVQFFIFSSARLLHRKAPALYADPKSVKRRRTACEIPMSECTDCTIES